MWNKQTRALSASDVVLGVQFLFVAFGATVLVPILVGIDPAVALFTAGIGTLIFHLITKGKVPVFLGSSFVFIAPIIASTKAYGLPGTLGGLIAVGLVYAVVSAIIKMNGKSFIEKLFPPEVVGPVIIAVGASLASVAVEKAAHNWWLAMVSLLTAVVSVIFGKKMLKLIPIFMGIFVGYLVALLYTLAVNKGIISHSPDAWWALTTIDFSPMMKSGWFTMPKFVFPEFNLSAILYMLPVAIAPIIEHVGDMYAIGNVADKNFVKEPGLHRTMLGDGVATAFAGFFGGPPNTTYSEVTGAISLTKVTNPVILRISAITAVCFSFIGKVSGFLQTIPEAVLGGIMLLLFGMIASVGLKSLIDAKVDLTDTRTQVIVSIILIFGVGDAVWHWGEFSLAGIGLASVIGIAMHLLLPKKNR
ncbi:uracil permease [bacterium DOLZORAL124_38_8]|nr:MAG: uracil permease [bacterium DOLZORAL124_38_8]